MIRGSRWYWQWVGLAVIVALALVSGCRQAPKPTTLDDLVRLISKSQDVEESVVRLGISQHATTSGEQLRLAQQWHAALPERPIPRLSATWDDLAKHGLESLKSATCEAVFDTLQTGEVPDGETFISYYLTNVVENVPAAELASIAAEFDELWQDAAAGTLTATDARFTLMAIKYC